MFVSLFVFLVAISIKFSFFKFFLTIYTSTVFNSTTYAPLVFRSTPCTLLSFFFLVLLSNSSAMNVGSSSGRERKSPSSLKKKEILVFEIGSMVSDILLERLEAYIVFQEVSHKLDLFPFQMEEAIELLRCILRCL